MPPKISIVLPIYNVGNYITETINSLLAQSYQNFELLVFDDRSTDDTVAKVQAIKDPRLRFFQNEQNLGRAGTDNAAIAHITGDYVAKMDGDDICHPERLAQEVDFLERNPDINVVGSWLQYFGASTYLCRYPTTPEDTRVLTLFSLPTGNASIMMRTELFKEEGLRYNAALRQTEDYDFFARYIRKLRVATIPQALLQYRVQPSTLKTDILSERNNVADEIRVRLLQEWNIPLTDREAKIHNVIAMVERPLGDISLAEVEAWLSKLIKYNEENQLFDPAALRRGLGERWFEVCYNHIQPRLGSISQFKQSHLARYFSLSPKLQLKFLAKSMQGF